MPSTILLSGYCRKRAGRFSPIRTSLTLRPKMVATAHSSASVTAIQATMVDGRNEKWSNSRNSFNSSIGSPVSLKSIAKNHCAADLLRRRWISEPGCQCCATAFYVRAQKSQDEPRQKNRQQSIGRRANTDAVFGQNGKFSINKLEVHPIHQKGCLT